MASSGNGGKGPNTSKGTRMRQKMRELHERGKKGSVNFLKLFCLILPFFASVYLVSLIDVRCVRTIVHM